MSFRFRSAAGWLGAVLVGWWGSAALPVHAVDVPRVVEEIEVDGRLEEAAWSRAATFDLDYAIEPGENDPAPVETRVHIFHDGKRLYVAFEAFDPAPDQIRASLDDRDRLLEDDVVEVLIDPLGDGKRAFRFAANPLGVQADGLRDEVAQEEDSSWDALWESAGRITEGGYAVEMAIPFRALRFKASEEDQAWIVWPRRRYPRAVKHVLSPVPWERGRTCLICQGPRLRGFAGARPGKQVEVVPTLSAIRSERPTAEGDPVESTVDPGLDLFWGATPSVELQGTINPDFSTIELDEAQLETNTRFALFFPEKRPFFLEGADLFSTPLQAFYSRSIADPRWGWKATGSWRRGSMALLVAEDEQTNLLVPSPLSSFVLDGERSSVAGVGRFRWNLGRESFLGVWGSSRSGSGYANRVGGLDGQFRPTGKDQVTAQVLWSRSRLDAELASAAGSEADLSGRGLHLSYAHRETTWSVTTIFEEVDDGFRADLGFVRRTGIRKGDVEVVKTWLPRPGAWHAGITLDAWAARVEDRGGELLDRDLGSYVGVTLPGQIVAAVRPRLRHRRVGEELLELRNVWWSVSGKPGKVVRSFFLAANHGEEADYVNGGKGSLARWFWSLDLAFGRRVKLSYGHWVERLGVAGGRLYLLHLPELRLKVTASRRFFTRLVLQYQALWRDPRLYSVEVAPRERRLAAQFLATYRLDARTVVYGGYSSNYVRLEEANALGAVEERMLFAKVSLSLAF